MPQTKFSNGQSNFTTVQNSEWWIPWPTIFQKKDPTFRSNTDTTIKKVQDPIFLEQLRPFWKRGCGTRENIKSPGKIIKYAVAQCRVTSLSEDIIKPLFENVQPGIIDFATQGMTLNNCGLFCLLIKQLSSWKISFHFVYLLFII